MLYERWCQTAERCGNELALRDLATGQHWTFAALARRVERGPVSGDPVVYPQGRSADFVFAVLQGWRGNAVVCPLDPEQKPLSVPRPVAPCCHLKTTSASTGAPRTIAFTAAQLAADAANIVATMGLRPDWPNLGVISMAHSYGFSNLVLPLLLHGIPLIVAPSPLPEAIRSAAKTAGRLTLAAVPALWRAWHEADVIPRTVHLAISAGALLQASLEHAVWESSGLKIHNFYGSSECGGIAFDAAETPRGDDAGVGTGLQNVALALNDEGCLQVRSHAVGETYWPDAEASLQRGCFQTNDLAELKDGQVYLRGRLSDQINVAGRKISPATIERTLGEHAAVRECLVFGIPSRDRDRSEVIVACVAVKAPATDEDLKQFLMTRLPAWQVPREWWRVESLAADPRGKLSRAHWRQAFLESRAGGR